MIVRRFLFVALLASACESSSGGVDGGLDEDAPVEDVADAEPVPDAPLRPDARAIDAAPAPDAPPPDAAAPAFVRIVVESAVIAPATSDRSVWDGVGSVSMEEWANYLKAVSQRSYDAVLDVISAVGASGLERPDPVGTAELFVDGASQKKIDLVANSEDTFTPKFSSASFTHVRWTTNVRVQVSLVDEDLTVDDPIGSADIEAGDLAAALAARAPYHVFVGGKTSNQLPYVTVTVSAE